MKKNQKIMILSLGKTCWMSLKKFTSKFLVCWLKYTYIIKNYSRTWWTQNLHNSLLLLFMQSHRTNQTCISIWTLQKFQFNSVTSDERFFFLIQLGCTVQNWFFKKLKNVNKLKYWNVFEFSWVNFLEKK